MKRLFALLLICCAVCGGASCAANTEPYGITDTLRLSFDLSAVSCPARAAAYEISNWTADEERLCRVLLPNERAEKTLWATGPQYGVRPPDDPKGEFQEILNLFDQDMSQVNESYTILGYDYLRYDSPVVDVCNFFNGSIAESYRRSELDAYAERQELSFALLEDALQDAQRKLADTGLPETTCVYAAGFTGARLQALAAAEKYVGKDESITLTGEHDCYYLLFRQEVDGIFIAGSVSRVYPESTMEALDLRVNGGAGGQSIYAFYGRDGLIDLYVRGVVSLGQKIQEYELLSAREALKTVVEHYKTVPCEPELIYAEFCYTVVTDMDGTARVLQPCWQFVVREKSTYVDPTTNKEREFIEDYTYFVNAATGVVVSLDPSIDVGG